VKLLLDQNLSHRLADRLASVFPGSVHVRSIALERAGDDAIWRHAIEHGFAIVIKDSDFHERAQFSDPHPKIVWIRRRNCSTSDVEAVLRRHRDDIDRLGSDAALRYLILV
jgi:predicted nuclease of predicted toxin-antitoxin system